MPTFKVSYTATIEAVNAHHAIQLAHQRAADSTFGDWTTERHLTPDDDADDKATTEQALACPACRTQAEQIATHNAVRSGWTGDTDELQGEVDDLIRDSEARCTAH